MPSDVAIEVESLKKTYRGGFLGRHRIEAVKGVSFQVGRGEIFGLLGPNGAGKTTVVKLLLGIVHKTGGSATLLGRPAGDLIGRRRVGYLPESHRIPRHHSGNSAMAYYGRLSGLGEGEIKKRRPGLLEKVGLAEWGKTSIKKYSKGMLQRLGLAQTMLHDPDVLILDEPTDGVDPVGRSEIRVVLRDLKEQGKTIFINSHLLQEIELICDRVVILNKGEVLSEGNVSDFTQHEAREVEFTLVGAESDIRAALGQFQILSYQEDKSGECVVTVRASVQASLDACIDGLRGNGVSIVSVSRRRQTLEEAFMSIVEQRDSKP